MTDQCSIDGCDKPIKSREWCNTHYARWQRTGTTVLRGAAPIDRFWSHVQRGTPEECWLWTGFLKREGYGSFTVGSQPRRNAHRWIWEYLNGPASSKMHVDHLCRNRQCVNPDHLELVTHAENLRRGVHANYQGSKTHCIRGHVFDEANTYRLKGGGRSCRECQRQRQREFKARVKLGRK